jgi:hypothetical protein
MGNTTMAAAGGGVLDTTTLVLGRGDHRGRRVEEPCVASAEAAAAAAAVVADVAANTLPDRVDRDSRNMGVDEDDDDILDSHQRCYCQTIRIHARRLLVNYRDVIPIPRCPGSTVVDVVVAAVVVMVVDNHHGHTAAEVPRSDLVEVVRDDVLAAAVARSKKGSIHLP